MASPRTSALPRWRATLVALSLTQPALAQTPSSSELLRDIENLQVVGSALYVAAHPDDENTRLLHELAERRGLRTAYLSITRGGGGQNLIGTEQSEMLGVVRTGELMAARSIDGAEQRFTRARDFGYSKSPEEALAIWGHEETLSDVVGAIRSFRPDVIITRFSPEGGGHGHHTASARLAVEAFNAAADPERFEGDPWQADRILRNQSSWRRPDDFDPSQWPQVEVGGFDPLTGRSVGEIAAASRTMHKSQGFGASPSVTPQAETFEPLAGVAPAGGSDVLDGLDLGWSRFEDTKPLQKALEKAVERFDPRAPHAVLPQLAKAHGLMTEVSDPYWRQVKLAELEQVMLDCAGLWLTARSEQPAVAPGDALTVDLLVVNRSPVRIASLQATLRGHQATGDLRAFGTWEHRLETELPADEPLTVPHWLAEPPSSARYAVDDPAWRNAADTPSNLRVNFAIRVAGVDIQATVPVVHAWTDRVHGERGHQVEVLPPATVRFEQPGLLLPEGETAVTKLVIRAPVGETAGTVSLTAPEGVSVNPAEVSFELTRRGADQVVELALTAGDGAKAGPLQATVHSRGGDWTWQQRVIDHTHLPRRSVLSPAQMALSPVALDRGGARRIGYVMGSGDTVPDVLRGLGYAVEELDEDALLAGDLGRFDAIVLGIRAYNTRPRLMTLNPQLLDYVAGGGRVVMQYNTNSRWSTLEGPIGPAPFTIGRGRVTDETAPMTALDPEYPALVGPNALTPGDFDDWVQERGLYFATEWDAAWTPLFSSHDAGEDPLEGSTLVAVHGEGVFVYTGLSFFRQLPAGVPGATRLFANLLALNPAENP